MGCAESKETIAFKPSGTERSISNGNQGMFLLLFKNLA